MDSGQRALSRAADQGDVDAAARLLAERLRAGDLGPGWVELACAAGDRVAALCLGVPPLDFDELPIRAVESWTGPCSPGGSRRWSARWAPPSTPSWTARTGVPSPTPATRPCRA